VQVLSSAASSLSAGAYFSCATTASGVSCWGQNSYGQVSDVCACREDTAHTSMKLGLGYYNASGGIVSPQPLVPSPNISNAAIFAGTVHTCAVASGSM
jgi:hypothetical protein